ncbi:MAG TPA: hypothetical protein VMV45_17550 [Casimicrobiaceae bacterium]|nr:hypothetical protein [Casimicrobiaceae bacterium]
MAIASRSSLRVWKDVESANVDGAHVDWLVDTQFRYVSPRSGVEVWVPLLIKLRAEIPSGSGMTAAQFAAYAWSSDADEARTWIRIPAMYRTPPSHLATNRFLTAMVTAQFFDRKSRDPRLAELIERYEIGAAYLLPEVSKPVVVAQLGNTLPRQVLAAAIDDGFAYAHEQFRRSDGKCRVAYLWDQDGPPFVPSIGYGSEITGSDIDSAIASGLDEERIYRTLSLDYRDSGFKPLGRRASHGTAALGLAFGRNAAQVAPTQRLPIVLVKLPNRVTENPSDLDLDPWVVDAIYYIHMRADDISRQEKCGALPIVLNLSYGTTHGPHDGTSLLEQAIDSWVTLRASAQPPVATAVVLPSGNAYLGRCHATLDFCQPRVRSLAWRVLPDDCASSWNYLYVKPARPNANPIIRVALVDPAGNGSALIGVGQKTQLLVDGWPVAEIVYSPSQPGYADKISVWIAPTANLDASLPLAPSGKWIVRVESSGDECVVNAWIRRGESPPGHPRAGHQSYFDDDAYAIYQRVSGRIEQEDNATSYVRRAGSMSGIATGAAPIVVGGAQPQGQYANPRMTPAAYSGAGPVGGLRPDYDPDVLAVSEDAVTLHGVLGIGARSGSVVATNGTSVAAPQVARIAWHILQQGQWPTHSAIESLATKVNFPKDRAGAGVIPRSAVTPRGKARR